MKHAINLGIIVALVSAATAWWLLGGGSGVPIPAPIPVSTPVTSFLECVAAGNPVMESYPRQCRAGGQTFREIVGTIPPEPAACTADAKQCPDGSYVGRSGPKCEFAKCPDLQANTVTLRAGEREGSLLVEKIFDDRVTGLNFAEYPVAREEGFPVTLRIGETASNGCTVTLTLVGIQGGSATFTKKTDFDRPCPICLAKNTLIDTPYGAVAVQDLTKGAPIWTVTAAGERVVGSVALVGKTAVPAGHTMVELILSDGRSLSVSPGHPTTDGRSVGELATGDIYDGVRVVSVARARYHDGYTYDILPTGDTGFYYANGVLLGSTLR